MDRNHIISLLPDPTNAKMLLFERQHTADIMKTILEYHKKWQNDYDKIARQFIRENNVETARAIFDFLKKNIKYKVEPGTQQTVKSPAIMLLDGLGDCKHYSLFTVGVFDALKRMGIPVDIRYRFAAYNRGDVPKHVFAILKQNGQEYWVDPVLQRFDQRSPRPSDFKDYTPDGKEVKPNVGELYAISGVGEDTFIDYWEVDEMGKLTLKKFFQGQKTNLQNLGKGVKKVAHGMEVNAQNLAKGAKITAKNIAQGAKKISLAPGRNAYLALMKINFGRIASQLWKKAAYDTNSANWKKVEQRWKQLGGNPAVLHVALRKGRDYWNKRHPNQRINGEYNMGMITDLYDSYSNGFDNWVAWSENGSTDPDAMIGEPVSTAALLAAAAPIISAMAALLAALNVKEDRSDELPSMPVPGSAQDSSVMQDTSYSQASDYSTYSDYTPTAAVVPPSYTNEVDSLIPTEEKGVLDDFSNSLKDFYYNNKKTIWIVGGVAAAMYIIPRVLPNKTRRRRR